MKIPWIIAPDVIKCASEPLIRNIHSQKYVPKHNQPLSEVIEKFQELLNGFKKLCVLTGAGISTESGIPDYRSKDVGLYDSSKHRPMQHQEFIKSGRGRQRYWARNFLGWKHFQQRYPNESHHILSEWEKLGKVHHLVTQNVDALHTKAGSQSVTELHGCMSRVVCLNCGEKTSRSDLQPRLHRYNEQWGAVSEGSGPDADEFVRDEDSTSFKVPSCKSCKGILKPDVVFFGDNVNKNKVNFVMDKVTESDGLLILGSSLYVWSGFRFILHAYQLGIPIICVNIGPTRADDKLSYKISAKCSDVLSKVQIST